MEKICINTTNPYDILIGRDCLKDSGKHVLQVIKPCKVCLIADNVVHDLYEDSVTQSLTAYGFQVFNFVFPHGEISKNLDTITSILEFMAKMEFTRSDIIVALGGGITGDISGFAAATFQRGIRFVQIPTTFLAAVDSSVGGKTGVNLKSGKNLAGAFWQPSLVLCDCNTFSTLSYEIFLDGIAEAIKYGAITDKALFDALASYGDRLFSLANSTTFFAETDALMDIVKRCITIKCDIVTKDERDTGERQLLNFGHTLGHAIEKCSNYEITHGHAVAIGMLVVCRASHNLGLSTVDCSYEMEAILSKFNFPMACTFSAEQLSDVALKDKKRTGDFITLVLPTCLGKCRLEKLPTSQLKSFITAGLN